MTGATEIKGGEALARTLEANGVSCVFSLAGTAHTFLLEALDRGGRIATVSVRHETCAVLAADGYARISGKVGVALIKNDQGLPNAMTGLCTANAACSPVVVLTSLSPSSSLESGGDPGDELAMAESSVKWASVVPSADRMAEYLNMAFRQASSGRPGVALLGIRQEYQQADVPAVLPPPHPLVAPPAPDLSSIHAVVDLLRRAKRPLILTGRGACIRDEGAAVKELATRFGIPVLGNSLGRGILAEDCELGWSWPLAQVAAARSDLILAFGIRMTQRLGYGLPPRFAKDTPVVQIDIHAEELGRNRPVDIAIQADAAATATTLTRALEAAGQPPFPHPDWIKDATQARRARIDELGRSEDGEIHPYAIGRVLARLLPPAAVLVGDGADILNWLHGVYPIRRLHCYMDHYPFGSMGVGTGLALGAGVALKEEAQASGQAARPLILLTGDGAFGFRLLLRRVALVRGGRDQGHGHRRQRRRLGHRASRPATRAWTQLQLPAWKERLSPDRRSLRVPVGKGRASGRPRRSNQAGA